MDNELKEVIKQKLEDVKGMSFEEYLPEGDIREYQGWVDALKWVLEQVKDD